MEANSYKVLFAVDGKEGITLAASHLPDLILLDLGLPDMNGQEVLLKLREWYQHPIIILSVKNAESEIVQALDNGANDYMTKPFRTQELLARIRTALRRNLTNNNSDSVLTFGSLVVDLVARTVKVNNEIIKFTATEYNLLTLLIKNDGRVLTHQYILKEIWGQTYSDQTQYLRVLLSPNRALVIVLIRANI